MESDDLYGLPLERFTEERNALAKQLRRDGRRSEAADVSKLRKPSVAAWAVNQLVRTRKRDVDALLKAGDRLQKAQADLLAKRGKPGELRMAVDAERAAVERLTDKARGLLSADGHELTPARLERVSDTLHAAALDEVARAQVRDGSLVRELRHVGLGALGAQPTSATDPKRSRSSKTKTTKAIKAVAADRAAIARVRKTETDARRQMERALAELRAAEKRRERAARELSRADEALRLARAHADQTDSPAPEGSSGYEAKLARFLSAV